MERSPRSAAVRPRTRASMGQYHTLRSFVISLAIAIAITKSPASGFTIARDILNSSPDLETGESRQLEVRHDLKTLNKNETVNNNKTRGDSDSTVIAIKNINNNTKQNYSDENVNEKQLIVNATADTQPKISDHNKIEITPDTTTIISTETDTYGFAYTTVAPITSQITTTETETTFSEQILFTTQPEFEYTTVTNNNEEKEIQENVNRPPKDQKSTEDITSTSTSNLNNASNNVNKNNIYKSDNGSNDVHSVITTITDSENKVTTESDLLDQKAFQSNTKKGSIIANTDELLDAPTTVSSELNTDVIVESAMTGVTSENFTAEVTTTELPTTLPSWKKYTTIDRRRTSTEVITTTGKDMVQAAQTRISLEKVFTNAPIPSLEKLGNDLINAPESTTGIESNVSYTSDSESNISTIRAATEIETEPTKLEIVSKRAGYKDNREVITSKIEEAIAAEFSPRESANNTQAYETEAGGVEETKNKKGSGFESQSQLTEDAIKEELLREETLNDYEENAKLKHMTKQGKIDGAPELVTDDVLSVKPIGQEKKKNTILYAVSPNYKPLKKIDIQPPKQFVRDPDDNSWRNESISSLGIVFKPKNASKSFTQVLKNKTETELLGNMTDRDSKEDLPDLRVRLEKIAEVRKSKKKINKFGDTVYSDYEESSENTNPAAIEDTTTPMSPTVESILNFSPLPPSQSSTTEVDLTVNAISTENFDLFKTEKSSSITTNKPKKFYNLAEYYDANDEYDAEYVNQHNIDLKKYTKTIKTTEDYTTRLPELLRTQPMREYQPERKATLQYFPPTQKVVQKVNVNDYDTNFNKKVNLYDVSNAPPRNTLAASFGTVSPMPTEKFEPINKVTMKPAYTPIYHTEDLNKNLYLTNQPGVSVPPPGGFVPNDGNFNRASYAIKHYRDFINEAAKDGEEDKSEEYTYTESPVRGVTVNELAKMSPHDSNQGEEDYEYDVKFRKDILNRFVDNFNQNSEKFKVDFPILYNSSVVHSQTPEQGRVASSTAFMKRLYEVGNPRPANFLRRPCDPQCDKTVELSPAYELHYYVPDEEEKEVMEPRTVTAPYRFRL